MEGLSEALHLELVPRGVRGAKELLESRSSSAQDEGFPAEMRQRFGLG